MFVLSDDLEFVEILIKSGADPNFEVKVHNTRFNMLEYAILLQREKPICRLLHLAGARVRQDAWCQPGAPVYEEPIENHRNRTGFGNRTLFYTSESIMSNPTSPSCDTDEGTERSSVNIDVLLSQLYPRNASIPHIEKDVDLSRVDITPTKEQLSSRLASPQLLEYADEFSFSLTLAAACRNSIRGALRWPHMTCIDELVLPDLLKQYLRYDIS
jgi:hypothetical protein